MTHLLVTDIHGQRHLVPIANMFATINKNSRGAFTTLSWGDGACDVALEPSDFDTIAQALRAVEPSVNGPKVHAPPLDPLGAIGGAVGIIEDKGDDNKGDDIL